MNDYAPFSTSANFCDVIHKDSKKIFRKVLSKKSIRSKCVSFLKKMDSPLSIKLRERANPSVLVNDLTSPEKSFEREIQTWYLWRDSGIEVPALLLYSDNEINFEYIEGAVSMRHLLRDNNFAHYDHFLNLYARIRHLALDRNDSRYLHTDPHLGNFIVSLENKIYPIDSGVMIKDLPLEDINAGLICRTLYSLSVILSDNDFKNSIESYRESLRPDELSCVNSRLKEPCIFASQLINMRSHLAAKLKNRTYTHRSALTYYNRFPQIKKIFS